MVLSKLLTLASIFAAVSAATTTAAPSPSATESKASSTPSASTNSTKGPQVHTVLVGSGGFKFTPNKLENVNKGDTVTFEFYPKDHSVARAEYMSPCVPYEDTGKGKVGFYSGVHWVNTVNDLTYYNLTINDTEPIFFYCTAKGSCNDQQMVGVINPNASMTLETQIAFAKNSTLELAPGDEIPPEATGSLTQATNGPTATPSAGANSASTEKHDHKSTSLSGGAIAGIVVGCVAFLAICAALFFFVGRTKSLKEAINRNVATVTKITPGAPGTPAPFSDYGSPMASPMLHGYSPVPSPGMHHQSGDFSNMNTQLPPYQQHGVGEPQFKQWGASQLAPGVPQMSEVYESNPHHSISELASPTPNQQEFVAELEGPIKSPRT
ncbi:hypothetical protein GQ43DRAFT_418430 [Delitschia confertaspora ATCC 74209]|uniref:Extracellular serine-rich protein n=1 Tax=Delitschia confertaspora ATCC 74209 TaxID=1513339 RepID=A0A9P4MRT2_9PLEO|nr:hypothetical protein GQ43DRAFT_418430 [Delitschia confertaspora ATCC 74209]